MKQIKQAFSRTKAAQAITFALLSMVAGMASATTTIPGADGAASDAFTQIMGAAGDMIANAWPLLIAVAGGMALLKVGKKVIARAT